MAHEYYWFLFFVFIGEGEKIGNGLEMTVCSVSMIEMSSGWPLHKSPSSMKQHQRQ